MGEKYYLEPDGQIYVTDHLDGLNVRGRLVDLENLPNDLPDVVRKWLERMGRENVEGGTQIIDMERSEEGVYRVK